MKVNRLAFIKRASNTPIYHKGSENIFTSQSLFRQTWSNRRFSFATLNLIISLCPLWQLLKNYILLAEYKGKLYSIETTRKKLAGNFETPRQRYNGGAEVTEVGNESFYGKTGVSSACTQFLRQRKSLLIDLKEQLERYCNMLPYLVSTVQNKLSI